MSIICLLVLTGCSLTPSEKGVDTSNLFSDVFYSQLAKAGVFDTELIALEQTQIEAVYIHPDYAQIVEEAMVYITQDTSINELAVFKGKSEVKELCLERVEELRKEAVNYFPNELTKVDDYLLVQKGDVYILVIGQDISQVEQIIDSLINNR